MFRTQQLRSAPAATMGVTATEPRCVERASHRRPAAPSRREGARRSVTIGAHDLRVLFRASYFALGVLIGAAIWLAVFLVAE